MAAAAPGEPLDVTCEGVRLSRGHRLVLDVPDLRFARGMVTALVGPNGAGKSSLLRLIAALEKPDNGRVLVGGEVSRPERVRRTVAYAFQSAVFLAGSVRSNLDLALKLRGLAAGERRVRIDEAARACGIEGLLDRDAHRLSGGEGQRANLARALSLNAPVTLLDEPLSGLDGPARRQLLHDLPGILRGFATTTIVVTHDRDEALRLAQEIVVLIDGRVRAAGPRAAVFGSPPDADTARFLGYTLIPAEGALLAVAPRALHAGEGEVTFEMEVDEVLDLGVRREVWGRVNGVVVSVSLAAGAGRVPPAVTISAPREAITRFALQDQ